MRLDRTGRALARALTLMVATAAVGLAASAGTAWSLQDDNRATGIAFAGVFLMVFLAFVAAAYVYFALCIQTIAKKTNTPDTWMAWVPIAQAILLLNIAHKPVWWIVWFLVPLANIVVAVIVWMEVAKARGKPEWWGILMIVPVANLIAPAYLAFAD